MQQSQKHFALNGGRQNLKTRLISIRMAKKISLALAMLLLLSSISSPQTSKRKLSAQNVSKNLTHSSVVVFSASTINHHICRPSSHGYLSLKNRVRQQQKQGQMQTFLSAKSHTGSASVEILVTEPKLN